MFPIASNSDDETLYVDDVFSTTLYTGNGSTQTITNGIDLAGKGGLVWTKSRSNASGHNLIDSARGIGNYFDGTQTLGVQNPYGIYTDNITSLNSTGYTLGAGTLGDINTSTRTYASWTFRKAAKFFDVVTYTGNGTPRAISHNLGVAPGFIITKCIDGNAPWICWHSGIGVNSYINLNETNPAGTYSAYFPSAPTSTVVNVGAGASSSVNGAGKNYVMYLFAHDTSSTGIIQCGSFTPTAGAVTLNLGWETQWLLIKRTDSTSDWWIFDNMRGFSYSGTSSLSANTITEENVNGWGRSANNFVPTATGFYELNNLAAGNYIYMAIRRSNKPPTSGTQVYNAIARAGTGTNSLQVTGVGFSPDMVWPWYRTSAANDFCDRLRGPLLSLRPTSTQAETTQTVYTVASFDMNGYTQGTSDGSVMNATGQTFIDWFFKRAPGFFDIVCFTGTGANMTIPHNLTTAPELIIFKTRSVVNNWFVCLPITGADNYMVLNLTNSMGNGGGVILGNGSSYIAPTSSNIYLATPSAINSSGATVVSYLFATLAGISKVGSYTGNGGTQNIDCGFGSKYSAFVLIKRTDSTGDWYVWDTARGITTSIDPHLSLNTTAAEVSSDNSVDLVSSGFTVIQNSTTNINVTNATYIYLSIARSVSYLTGGEALFTTPGTFYWTCPAGVTEACVVCIGGGGGLGGTYGSGNAGSGAGGALSYINNYAVTPGTVYTVVVGGAASSSSCFGITAGGGLYYNNRLASSGGTSFNGGNSDGGGGGAGGYTGEGGYGGGQLNSAQAPRNGQGLGAGGGGSGGSANTGTSNAGGGGASLYGGAGGNGGAGGYNTAGNGGAAASTTTNNGENGKSGVEYGGGGGGKYGGGGGSLNISGGGYVAGIGASGAVRIMWGSGRSFPYAAG